MSFNLPDFKLSEEWTDLSQEEGYSAIAGKTITVQAKYATGYVWIGGTEAPEGDSGSLLEKTQAVTGKNTNWWVKGSGLIAIIVED